MFIIKLADKLGRKMRWYDFSLLKLTMLFFTLFFVTVWPAFGEFALGLPWYHHLILGIIFALPICKKMFSKD